MSEDRKSNFERMAESSRRLFLSYDREKIAGKYGTPYDAGYLAIDFLGTGFRIGRDSGLVEAASEDGWISANASETMIFYDLFCYGMPGARASGEFVNHGSLVQQLSQTADPGSGLYLPHVKRFRGHADELRKGCERLGGISLPKGDVCFELPLFPFLKYRFQFWEEDDEFPAQIVIFVDKNILQFMHFETTWYASGCILERIAKECGL